MPENSGGFFAPRRRAYADIVQKNLLGIFFAQISLSGFLIIGNTCLIFESYDSMLYNNKGSQGKYKLHKILIPVSKGQENRRS